jgi:hypothetical protein
VTKNNHFPECANCTRSYETWCSYFEAKQTCDYKQFMQGCRIPFHDGPSETWIATIRLPVSVKSLLCITEGLTLEHGKDLRMRQTEDSIVIFKPNAPLERSARSDDTLRGDVRP